VNRDPFLRASLILVFSGAAAVLYAFFGPWRALAFAAVGVVFALFVSVDYTTSPEPEPEPPARRESPRTDRDGKPQGFERVRG
jgi:hypothetical protein